MVIENVTHFENESPLPKILNQNPSFHESLDNTNRLKLKDLIINCLPYSLLTLVI